MRSLFSRRAAAWAILILTLYCSRNSLIRGAEAPGTFEFAQGPLSLHFDKSTGNLLRITCAGREIAAPDAAATPVTFATGEQKDKVSWIDKTSAKRKLLSNEISGDTIELTVRYGDFELLERYRLHTGPPRVDRSFTLINRGNEVLKLRGVALRTCGIFAAGQGFYRCPTVWPQKNHPFKEMQPNRSSRGRGNLATAVAQLEGGKSLLFASYADDAPGIEIIEGAGQFEARQHLFAQGYLRPGVPQDMGFVSMVIADGDYWSALPKFWDWMDSVGLKIPADQPKWMRSAVLYSFHPGGTIGGRFKDLGGFEPARTQLLPTLPRLGIDSIWIMPIEYRAPYWPFDYYRFQDGLGTPQQYRALVDEAHRLKLRVLQDLVPHGGAPEAVHNKAHPEFMLIREDGTHLNYWLNDFELPAWRKFMSDVAAYYVKTYDIDGYRVDACNGSKEYNWNPSLPYARASLAGMRGGLDMLADLRKAVRAIKPDTGALLAECEGARHLAVSDSMYDFNLCYNLLHQWRKLPAADFARQLTEYFEEQKYAEPRGAVRLRHVESHDSLRSALWYGVDGMHAMYALSAWIDGLPLMYHNMEIGHDFELARINQIRHARPEIADGEALYRAASCDVPGVFTCERKLGDKTSVIAINFNREPVKATVIWPEGSDTIKLKPMGYTVLPADAQTPSAAPPVAANSSKTVTLDEAVSFDGATEWLVDTIEGRLHGYVPPAWTAAPPKDIVSSIYWRPQDPAVIWRNAMQPLFPGKAMLGFKSAQGSWAFYQLDSAPSELRLITWHNDRSGLWLAGGKGISAQVLHAAAPPPAPDHTAPIQINGVTLRVVGSQYIVSNSHYAMVLNRHGGAIAQFTRGGKPIFSNQELYGDQEYFTTREERRMSNASDVESGITISAEGGTLKIAFEGQIRGAYRFSIRRPAVWYRTSYTFDSSPKITQSWGFKTDKTIKNARAFLAYYIPSLEGDHFKFTRDGQMLADEALAESSARLGQTKGKTAPDTIEVSSAGNSWKLTSIKLPEKADCNLFFSGKKLFMTLLDGANPTMEPARWYDFSGVWE